MRPSNVLWLVQRSPPWRDLLHDLSKRSRLLHTSHPFSTVLRSSKVRTRHRRLYTSAQGFSSLYPLQQCQQQSTVP